MDDGSGPPEEWLARRLAARSGQRRSAVAAALHELAETDRSVYRAIASTPSPTLDAPLRRLSNVANQ
ncbi:MAG TPA: hypothetical protein VFP02_07405, partial [Acidimicrobiales bacterium]|nr:hypothetical protein [Acidimicrobiales bacterium]